MAPYLEAVMMYAGIMNNETFSNTYQNNGKVDSQKHDPKQLAGSKTFDVRSKVSDLTNVVQFPQFSEVDKQFVTLEKQQKIIREQSELIKSFIANDKSNAVNPRSS